MLRAAGVDLRGVAGDPMVADYLLHSGERSHNLDELARRYLGHENISITELIGKGKKQITMDRGAGRAKVARLRLRGRRRGLRLAGMLEPELEKERLRKLYDEVEVPLIEVLAELEFNGVRLDVPFLEEARPWRWSSSWRGSRRRSTPSPAGSSTSPRRSNCGRCCSTR